MAIKRTPILPMEGAKESHSRGKRILYWIGAVSLALVALAWFDGGEEPIRPIAVEVPLAEGH